MQSVDTLVLGAGAAGLLCAARTAARGRSTLVVDHARKPGEKIRISGGGRCNFTNLETSAHTFLSDNPHFAKSALARYTPWDFCDLMASHGLTWHEKSLGQLFCDQKSGAVVQMLLDELNRHGARLQLQTEIGQISHADGHFRVTLNGELIETESLVVATGGLSIPKMGATGLAFDIARQFGHDVIAPRPALVPLTFTGAVHDAFAAISGVAAEVEVRAKAGPSFVESLLFTHRGLSGPAILQVSSYWRESEPILIDLLPGQDARHLLVDMRNAQPRATLAVALAAHLPKRLADLLAVLLTGRSGSAWETRLAELSNASIEDLARDLKAWALTPVGTEGWRTAEVTAGGIDTAGLSSRTLESRNLPNLFFIGECVDVTGWLGGYNFQWAWASAAAAAEVA